MSHAMRLDKTTPKSVQGCKLWLSARQLYGVADGSGVASWPDLSGFSNTASQGTGADQPLFKTGIRNGQPVVRFDGTSDYMSANSVATSYLTGADQPFTVIAALALNALTDEAIFGAGRSSSATPHIEFYAGAEFNWTRRDDASTLVNNHAGTPATTWMVLSCVFSGTTHRVLINGTDTILSEANDVGTMTLDRFTVGALERTGVGDFAGMDLAEFALWNRALSDGERRKIERAFGRIYGIATS